MRTVTHIAGDTWKRAWLVQKNTVPLDLTGASARLHVRDKKTLALILSYNSADNGITITALDGRVDLVAPGIDMQLDPTKNYVFDLELTEFDGVVTTLEQAELKIKQDYTYGT